MLPGCTAWVCLELLLVGQSLCEVCGAVVTSKPLSAQGRRSLAKWALKYGDCQRRCSPERGEVEPSEVYEVSRSTSVGCSSFGFESRQLAACLGAAGV